MKRFLSRLKVYYGDFYKEGKFNQEVALGYMHDKSELNNRIKYIEGIFKVVKKTSKKEVWAWISSTHSLRDIATLYGINESIWTIQSVLLNMPLTVQRTIICRLSIYIKTILI